MPDAPIVKAEPSETGIVQRASNSAALVSKDTALVSQNPEKNGEKWVPQNMTYLVCDDVIRLDPPFVETRFSTDNPVVGLVMPSSALNSTSRTNRISDGGDFIEITCKLLDMNFIPRNALPPIPY